MQNPITAFRNRITIGLYANNAPSKIKKNPSNTPFLVVPITSPTACKISHKLVSRPVCLSTQGAVSLEMERYFASFPEAISGGQTVKAERVLEINSNHSAFAALQKSFASDKERAAKYAKILYGQALLAAGIGLDDTAEFTELVCSLMD